MVTGTSTFSHHLASEVHVAAASVFMQLGATVQLAAGDDRRDITGRTSGSLIGTRVAGCFGEIIVYDVMQCLSESGLEGLRFGDHNLLFST